MVKLIITAPSNIDIEGVCEIATLMAGEEYADTVLSPLPSRETWGESIQRYEIDGRDIEFPVADALSKICHIFPMLDIHCENDLSGENYATPESRVKVTGDDYHPTMVVDALDGDIDDQALRGLYHDGIDDIFTDIVNRHHDIVNRHHEQVASRA